MIRRRFVIFLGLAVLLGVITMSPRLFTVADIQSRLVAKAADALNADVHVARMRWRWGPLPHLTLYEVNVKGDEYALGVPKLRIYPDWFALLHGKVAPGAVVMFSPSATLHSLTIPSWADSSSSPASQPLPIPLCDLRIKNGSLSLPSNQAAQELFLPPIHISAINLDLRRKSELLNFSLSLQSTFFSSFEARGTFHADSKRRFEAHWSAKQLRADKLISSSSSLFQPRPEPVDFTCSLSGNGTESFELTFSGEFPSFTMQRRAEPVLFTFGNSTIQVSKKEKELTVSLSPLQLASADLALTGTVRRTSDDTNSGPRYLLDLAASEIDLDAVRKRLLTLLGDEAITATVCDVVRGGKAAFASYRFNGTLPDFANITAMVIEVEVERAEIHVPEVDLDLHNAAGPIVIRDGELSGHDLSCGLGNHLGGNGSFSLGLAEDNYRFTLDVDIDADLTQLPQTLHHLIDEPHFRREILQFSAKGRHRGHLSIGDDLRDFTVDVQIPSLAGPLISYKRLPWPISLGGGTVRIKNDHVAWQGVKAGIGPHALLESSGHLSWDNPQTPFTIDSLRATLDAQSLLGQLSLYSKTAALLPQALFDMNGTIHLDHASASGLLFQPEAWRYQLAGSLAAAELLVGELREPIVVNSGKFMLSDELFRLSESDTLFLTTAFHVDTELAHRALTQWRGWLEISGSVTSETGQWLAEQHWVPEPLFPKIPCVADKLRIGFNGLQQTVAGKLRSATIEGEEVISDLRIAVFDKRHQASSLQFAMGSKQARIEVEGDPRYDSARVAFDGNLDNRMLSALFHKPMLLSGYLEGECSATLCPCDMLPQSVHGHLKARDIQWLWGEQLRQATIDEIALSGSGEHIIVHNAHLSYDGEEAATHGSIVLSNDPLITTDLVLTSQTLSQRTITHFIDDLSSALRKRRQGDETRDVTPNKDSARRLAGKIILRAEEFIVSETIRAGKSERYRLVPLAGIFDFSGQGSAALHIDESQFCGLSITGSLLWHDGQSRKQFTLESPEADAPLLERFIACSGAKEEIIAGPFQVHATLDDVNGKLSGGSFHLFSPGGTVKKMALLAKIFTLVNFTDLYQGLFSKGFTYKVLEIEGHVANDRLQLDKAVIEGEGMDIILQGDINLLDLTCDMTVFLVPFKSVDKIINIVPLIGRIIGGKKRHVVTYPMRVTGPLRDPEITPLSATAIGQAAVDFLFDTLTLPLELLPPLEEDEERIHK